MKRLLKHKGKDQVHFVKLEKTESAYASFIRLTSSGIYLKSDTTAYIGSRRYVEMVYRIPRSNEMFQLSLGIVKGGLYG